MCCCLVLLALLVMLQALALITLPLPCALALCRFLRLIASDDNLDKVDETTQLDVLMKEAEALLSAHERQEAMLRETARLFGAPMADEVPEPTRLDLLGLVEQTSTKMRASFNLLAITTDRIQNGLLYKHRNKLLDLIERIPPK